MTGSHSKAAYHAHWASQEHWLNAMFYLIDEAPLNKKPEAWGSYVACPGLLGSSVGDGDGPCGASTCACLTTPLARLQVHPVGGEQSAG